ALHRGLTTEAKVLETLAQCMEKRNITKVRSAIDLGDARRESPAEAIAAVRFFQHGITGMEPQITFRAESLLSDVRVDFCHRQARLSGAMEGLGKICRGAGGAGKGLERERHRGQWLRERVWRVIRISGKELSQEAKFKEIKRATRAAQN